MLIDNLNFLLVSDVHLDFHPDKGEAFVAGLPDAEGVIIAGDLAVADMLDDCLRMFLNKYDHVIFVYGNHDFYGSSFPVVRNRMKILKEKLSQENVKGTLHVLDNSTTEIKGQRFVGSTLWFPRLPGIELKHRMMTDFRVIQDAATKVYQEHEKAMKFLRKTVRDTDIVITHHLPSPRSIDPEYAEFDFVNCFYVTDLTSFILERQPRIWCHGHTHASMDYMLASTRILCNPLGYEGVEKNVNFENNKRL
jgi:Icc-related predicted phosphoesterase